MLDGVEDPAGMGAELGAGLTEAELRWLRDREWARVAEDVLWRRTKLGLEVDAAMQERVEMALASAD